MPVWKALASLALLPALALLPSTTASNTVVNYPQVKKVQCATGSGSAVLTERGWVSAAHVTKLSRCRIDGHPIEATPEGDLDFSTIKVAVKGRGLKINCDGFKAMHWYFAVGYAGGFEWQTMTRHFAAFTDNVEGLRILFDTPTVIPGMSGGAVMDEDGAIVGIVNAFNGFYGASYSRALKDTSLCLNKR